MSPTYSCEEPFILCLQPFTFSLFSYVASGMPAVFDPKAQTRRENAGQGGKGHFRMDTSAGPAYAV